MKIEKKSTVRSKKIEHVVKGVHEVEFGRFHLAIEDGQWLFLHFNPRLSGHSHISQPTPDKTVWRESAVELFRDTIESLKAFSKEQAIAELEEAITRIDELI